MYTTEELQDMMHWQLMELILAKWGITPKYTKDMDKDELIAEILIMQK